MLAVERHTASGRPQDHGSELCQSPIPKNCRVREAANINLFENLPGSRERFYEDCLLITNVCGNKMKIFKRQGQIFGEGSIVANNSQHFSPCTMCFQSAPAKIALRFVAIGAAGTVDLTSDTSAHPVFFDFARGTAKLNDITNKFMPHDAMEIVVPAKNLDIRITNAGQPNA